MPDFQLSPADARDLTAFLTARRDALRVPEEPVRESPWSEEDAARGLTLIRQYSCSGCHRIGGSGSPMGPDLDQVASKLRPAYIRALLKDPKGLIPGTPMKDFELWDDELDAITAALCRLDSAGSWGVLDSMARDPRWGARRSAGN